MKTMLLLLISSMLGFSADWIAALQQAQTAISRGELVNAEQILNSSIDQAQAKFGHNGTQLDQPLEMLANVYQREKRYPDALAVHQRRLDIWTAAGGENAVVVGRVLRQLSVVERQAGNLADAEAHSRRALAIMTAAFVNQPPAAQASEDLAEILVAENRIDEAEQMLAMAQKTFEASVGAGSRLTAGVVAQRSALLKKLGRPVDPPAAPDIVYNVGASQVTAPGILSRVEPQYSEEARKHKLQGSVEVTVVVDATGVPMQIAILRPLGMGLDEAAINAVSQWRFSPGTKNGMPVAVFTNVEMTFHLL
jgi:TonB family protein